MEERSGLGYSGISLEGPLRRFMARVPRIMARLVRPTPTWQLKSRAGRGLDLSRPRPRLGLSWKSRHQKTGEEEEEEEGGGAVSQQT